jgi:hypothetical protein
MQASPNNMNRITRFSIANALLMPVNFDPDRAGTVECEPGAASFAFVTSLHAKILRIQAAKPASCGIT